MKFGTNLNAPETREGGKINLRCSFVLFKRKKENEIDENKTQSGNNFVNFTQPFVFWGVELCGYMATLEDDTSRKDSGFTVHSKQYFRVFPKENSSIIFSLAPPLLCRVCLQYANTRQPSNHQNQKSVKSTEQEEGAKRLKCLKRSEQS